MIETSPKNNPERKSQAQTKKVKPLFAYIILIGYTVVLFVIGVTVGKMYFWNTYSKTSFADQQIVATQDKLKANPKDPKTLTDLGWGYFQKGQYNQALTYYKQALEQDKNYFPAHLNLGLAYMEAQKYDLAAQALKTAISLNSKSEVAHLNLGAVYNKLQKYQEAVNELKIADQTSPGNVDTMYQLGLAYENLGKFSDAVSQYQGALSFDPKYTLAQQALTRVKSKVSRK